MQNISKIICQRFKEARRSLGLSQSELALELGCHQAALSMFENGNSTKLSEEYVIALAQKLHLDLEELRREEQEKVEVQVEPLRHSIALGFCPEPECPSCSAYAVGGRTFFRVTLQRGRYCAAGSSLSQAWRSFGSR